MEVPPQSSIQKTYLNVKRIYMGTTAAWTNNLETTIMSLKCLKFPTKNSFYHLLLPCPITIEL